MIPTIVIVGADKGGVGKTTLARTLMDYYRSKNIDCRAFDTEAPTGVLQRFYPSKTSIIDMTKAADQMKVFDTLKECPITLIDIRAGMLSVTLRMLNKTGFFDGIREGRLRIIVMHVLGGTMSSYAEVKPMAEITVGAKHFLIKNHINENSFFDWNDDVAQQAALHGIGDEVIEIPKLNELASEYVDATGVGFTDYIDDLKQSEVLRGYVRNWLRQVFAAYDAVKLTALSN